MKTIRQFHFGPRPVQVLRNMLAVSLVLSLHPALPARAAPPSLVYQTLPGAMVQETGDRVPNGSREVPLFATLTFDLAATPPSLAAVITNAVLEGGAPFTLSVRSSSGSQAVDASYRFTGDYLRDIEPSGTQYLFDWKFSAPTNGQMVWNGGTYWAGGHIWNVTISNLALVPLPWLDLSRVGPRSIQLTWATNFADYSLEHANSSAPLTWNTVTNVPLNVGERLAVILETDALERFYRLRKP
jgi:hypothetical protein